MALSRPDLQTLLSRAQSDISARLPGADPSLRRTLLGVLARIQAGSTHGLYGYLEWVAKQILVDTADADMLDRHGSIWGVPRKQAVAAKGSVTFTGVDGSSIAAGTLIQRGDAVQFTTDAIANIAAGVASVAVTAVVAGINGNTTSASALSLVSPIVGVDSSVTVDAAGITNGADVEADEAYRTRTLDRIRSASHGGAASDYVTWALEVAGVTRAWVYAQELGIGTVSVRFVVDNDPSSLIPDAAKVAEVQTYIDALRPVTADLTVVAPVAAPIAMTIALTPNDATTQAAVTAELNDLISCEATPGGTILLSHIREAISIAAGETNHVLSVPAADVTNTTGKIATLGVITWQ